MGVYDYSVENVDGSITSLADYRGKVLLIVNTATGCGFTPQYEDLERMYAAYREQGFEILDFPCNQFGNQAPGTDEEIHEFCNVKYNTEFPRFKKLEVNGHNASPLFAYLASQKGFTGFGKGPKAFVLNKVAKSQDKEYGATAHIKWNFTKFLIDREGNVVDRFEPTQDMNEVQAAIERLL